MSQSCVSVSIVCVAASLLVGAGCGEVAKPIPKIAPVTGTLTLDGQPLAEANISFEARDGSGMYLGRTDTEGKYFLTDQRAGDRGASLGEHRVRVEKPTEPGGPDTLPERYTRGLELTATVTPGENTIDFDLKSE